MITLNYEEYLYEYAKLRNLDIESLISIFDIIEDESKNISDFISWFNFAKESSLRMKDELSRKLKDGAIALTTMHKSKGLEWDKVYIINANELINTKIRKILGYKSSLELFNEELALLTPCD